MDSKKVIPAGAFKQGCLALLDEVAEQHVEIVITKRGQPVARLVPMQSDEERERAILGQLRGTVRVLVDEETFLAPTGEEAGWRLE
jgi:prevent-host-death family protein